MDFCLDFGNAWVKWFNPRTNGHGDYRHTIVQLSENDWLKIAGRGAPPEGIAKINGIPYAFGNQARRYSIPERPLGAARYRPDYYGIGMAYALAQGMQKSIRHVCLLATHPPADIAYAKHLCAAAKGEWMVEAREGKFVFNVDTVHTMDEPLAGYSHYVFTEKGLERRRNPLAAVTTLVVDIGGYTVDVAAIDPNGEVDVLSLKSTRTGVLNLIEQFERELRGNNSTLFMDTAEIDIRRIEAALLTGRFKFGKIEIPCATEATAALNGLTNDVVQIIRSAGGVANFDAMLVVGGGGALMFKYLEAAMPRAEFIMAEENTALMKYGAVFGAAKLTAMLRLAQVI